jgi:hypothetical protein
MTAHRAVLLAESELSNLGRQVLADFDSTLLSSFPELNEVLEAGNWQVLIFDAVNAGQVDVEFVQKLVSCGEDHGVPLIVLADARTAEEQMNLIEIGCDDLLHPSATIDELSARITKSIFHRVASSQLSKRLELATQTAQSAISGNSDLGATVQFLLSVHDCDNLDQLGQLFFTTIERYGLKCSLQMRGSYEIKNMEAHGMAKDLESQLIDKLKDADRFIDFGSRTVINFERVSVLVKNMPVDDPEKYGATKDSLFNLVQGLNARVESLEDHNRVLEERETLEKLSRDVHNAMQVIQNSYHRVMRDIASEVDKASEAVANRMPSLALTEKDETFIESTMDNCVENTNRIFNEGLMVDDVISKLDERMSRALKLIDSSLAAEIGTSVVDKDRYSDKHVELF